MISDVETDVVYISDRLEPRYHALVGRLRGSLSDHGIPMKVIRGTADIWVRDFMPVQVGPEEFTRFTYEPDYLKGYEHLITRPGDIGPIPEVERCATSDIVLDGGNVVGWGRRCIVTDKVFRENPGMGKDDVIGRLRELLAVEELVVIPKEPYDLVGHADGVVRFLDERTVVINEYSMLNPSYRNRLKSALRRSKLSLVEVPYEPREGRRGELPPAFGNYVNFLRVRGLIVMPSYGISEDEEACRIIEEFAAGSAVRRLDCSELSMEGGVLNCAAWTADSRSHEILLTQLKK
jgi:agmatine deiminase